ncbi:MAG: thiamine-phosphate kinase [Chloroflexi bacterium RBG_13_46_9]|nr:MAG: thiamine-phosphate kinase [Chloroflexi bacterium RBG_13_46_9]
MKLSQIGEFGLINRLNRQIISATEKRWRSSQELIIGIGDDAAVWKPQNPFQIITTDALIEGVHFSLKTSTWNELGWKSVAVNLSDIAAMGGIPMYALVSLGLPKDILVENIQSFYEGMLAATKKFEVVVIGGDTVGSPLVVVSVTIIGHAFNEDGKVLTRSAAKPGDKVAVTGYLGGSSAGLAMLNRGLKFPSKAAAELRRAHLQPNPRVVEGQKLVASGVTAGMDISDGLVGDLTHICEMSHAGALINVDAVPVSPTADKYFGDNALECALGGGEDYELLFTAPARVVQRAKKSMDCPITVIGEITAEHRGKVVLVDSSGAVINLKKRGWDAFKK